MSKLGCLERRSARLSKRAGPHNYRVRGGRVLITNDFGGWASLAQAEYEQFLAGKLPAESARRAELARGGFLREEFSVDAAGADVRAHGLLSWRGPGRHVVVFDEDGRRMELETARRVVDFIFSGPAGPLRVELEARDIDASWPLVWFCVQYARRKSEWYGRPLALTLRLRAALDAQRREFLAGHGVALRAIVMADGASTGSFSGLKAERGLVLVGTQAREAHAWADWIASAGWNSVRVRPAKPASSADAIARFRRFYAQVLDGILRHARTGSPLREEWAASALSRSRGAIEGLDVAAELAYGPDGKIRAGETALAQRAGGETAFDLGPADAVKYPDLAANAVVKGCMAAACGDNQPLCVQCVYKPFCALSPARNYEAQGSLWGRTPESLGCALEMSLLDLLFDRLEDETDRGILESWTA